MPGDEQMTTANREQRRAAKTGSVRQIAKASDAAFEPRVIGSITMEEARQLKVRTEILENLQKEHRLLGYEIQMLQTEASTFVTNIANAHGNPPGAQCSIDSETGEITQIAPGQPEEPPIGLPVVDIADEPVPEAPEE